MASSIIKTEQHYERMMYKEALKSGFFEFQVTHTPLHPPSFTSTCAGGVKSYGAIISTLVILINNNNNTPHVTSMIFSAV